MKRNIFTSLILMLLVLSFFSCSGFPPIVIPPPDIEITICQNNPTPTTARENCPNKEVRKYPEGTIFPICILDHTVPPPPPIEYVRVDTCKDSGEMRNTYCPDPRIEFGKKYVKGTEPKTWCSFHKKPDPLIPEPKSPYIGTDHYQFIEEKGKYVKTFFEKIHEHGGNYTTGFLVFTWSKGVEASPFEQVGTWTEADKWWPEDHEFPTFDLDKWNEQTWDNWRNAFRWCKENGLALEIRILDYCSIKDGYRKRHNPFNNGSNIQNYTGGMWGVPIQRWYKKLNRKLIKTINEADFLDYCFFVDMNESDVAGSDPEDTPEWKDMVCKRFHKFMSEDLMSLGVRKDQIMMNIFRPNVYDYFKSENFTMQIHGVASLEMMVKAYQDEGLNIFPVGDGPDKYAKGNANFKGYREPSYTQGIKMGKYTKDKRGYSYLNRVPEETKKADIRKADFTALDGLVKGLNSPGPALPIPSVPLPIIPPKGRSNVIRR